MSPKILNAPPFGRPENATSDTNGPGWNRAPDETESEAYRAALEEDLKDKEHNPWRNHEDDQSKWLGLLLAAVGLGAIGYLISVA